MEQTNYIVAIDLGTSHLVGMVGKKTAQGTLAILAEEVEGSASCIRRGCVYNIEETAHRINRLITKLQNKLSSKLPGFTIEKAYIGIGSQSLRSYKHKEVKIINTDSVVSEEDIHKLDEQCRAFKPDMLDVLGILPPTYYTKGTLTDTPADIAQSAYYTKGTKTDNPVGIPCKRIEAHYRLIVGKPAIRNNIINSINRTKIKLAGIIVAPLALADSIFSGDEKELGCALIDFGAGVTAVVVYRQKELIHLSVIPLGGNLITKDLTSLRLVESDAEQLKITYGSAVLDKNRENTDSFEARDGIGLHEINTVVEARAREMVDNVCAQIKSTGEIDALRTIVLAGGASALKNLPELIHERFKKEVGFSTIRKEWMADPDARIGNPLYMTAISLLIKGTENCVFYEAPPVQPQPDPQPPIDNKEGVETEGGNFFDKLWKVIINTD